MKKFAIFVATTGAAVQIERLTEERAAQSMICLSKSTTILPISKEYHDYVRRGSGIIERDFDLPENTSFRADVSGAIDAGKSWQLAFYVAHAIAASGDAILVDNSDEADHVIWATGCVDYDLNILTVDHLTDKLRASESFFKLFEKQEKKVTITFPAKQGKGDHEQFLPEDIEICRAKTIEDLMDYIGLNVNDQIRETPLKTDALGKNSHPLGKFSLIVCLIILGSLFIWFPREWLSPMSKENNQTAIKKTIIEKPTEPPTNPEGINSKVVKPLIAEKDEKKVLQGKIEHYANVKLFALYPPQGKTCVNVNFGGEEPLKEALLKKIGGQRQILNFSKACRILFEFSLKTERFVGVWLKKISGRYIDIAKKPDDLVGRKIAKGKISWIIELPKKIKQPFHFKAFVLSGRKPLAGDLKWLMKQPNSDQAANELTKKGINAKTYNIKGDLPGENQYIK